MEDYPEEALKSKIFNYEVRERRIKTMTYALGAAALVGTCPWQSTFPEPNPFRLLDHCPLCRKNDGQATGGRCSWLSLLATSSNC